MCSAKSRSRALRFASTSIRRLDTMAGAVARDGDEVAEDRDGGGIAAGAGAEDADLAGMRAGDDRGVLRARRCARRSSSRGTTTGATQAVSVDVVAVVLGVRDLADGAAVGARARRSRAAVIAAVVRVVDLRRVDAQAERRARTESRASRAASPPSRSADGSASAKPRARASASASSIEQPIASIRESTALVVPFRIASMRVMRSPARPSPMRAHDRHRAADGRLEAQLPALARRQRQQRGAWCAITCLFAVTTDLPARSAARI